ncbi:hypothetical protein [Kallotenue papyrolyticum]|uniref:hypothetical protein n=1 Tax=Kallotenue papyrolyticum TaxID=1325125 RepID=UPI001268E5CA|nr:hypothetical protein [Kallotenue papyrolyticum]
MYQSPETIKHGWYSKLIGFIFLASTAIFPLLCCMIGVFVLAYDTACLEGSLDCQMYIKFWISVQIISTIPAFIFSVLVWIYRERRAGLLFGALLLISLLFVAAMHLYTNHRINEYLNSLIPIAP